MCRVCNLLIIWFHDWSQHSMKWWNQWFVNYLKVHRLRPQAWSRKQQVRDAFMMQLHSISHARRCMLTRFKKKKKSARLHSIALGPPASCICNKRESTAHRSFDVLCGSRNAGRREPAWCEGRQREEQRPARPAGHSPPSIYRPTLSHRINLKCLNYLFKKGALPINLNQLSIFSITM